MFKNIFLWSLMLVFCVSIAVQAAESINFWLMPNAPDDIHVPWLNEAVAEFKEQTGISVTYEIVGWGDAWTRITSAIATGEGVDVFQVGTTWNPQFAATGGLTEIDINEFGGAGAFMKANYISTTYQEKTFGVPWFAETRALFYNKDMFQQAGMEPPQTYQELYEAGDRINEKFGKGRAISIAGTNAWDLLHNWAIVLWAHGGVLVDEQTKTARFNEAPGVEAMKWYVGLVANGYADEACAEYNQPQADSAFINGNVAMCFMGPWNIANIEVENPDLNYDVVEPPAGPAGRASFSGGSNLVILKASSNQEAAKKWIKFLLEKQKLVDYTQNLSHMLPALLEAYDDPYYETGVWKVFQTTLSYATAYPPLARWGDVENAVQEEFRNILTAYIAKTYSDEKVQEYLDTAADRVNRAFARD